MSEYSDCSAASYVQHMAGSVAENGVHSRGIFRRAVNGKVRLNCSGKSSAVYAVRAADTVLSEKAVAEAQCKGKPLLAYIFYGVNILKEAEGGKTRGAYSFKECVDIVFLKGCQL